LNQGVKKEEKNRRSKKLHRPGSGGQGQEERLQQQNQGGTGYGLRGEGAFQTSGERRQGRTIHAPLPPPGVTGKEKRKEVGEEREACQKEGAGTLSTQYNRLLRKGGTQSSIKPDQ